MKEYIEREALLEAIDIEREELLAFAMFGSEHAVVHHARRLVEEAPAADVVPGEVYRQAIETLEKLRDEARMRHDQAVEAEEALAAATRRGRWEYLQDDEWRCSNCHTIFSTEGRWEPMTAKFCEECGADMRSDPDVCD